MHHCRDAKTRNFHAKGPSYIQTTFYNNLTQGEYKGEDIKGTVLTSTNFLSLGVLTH